VRKIKDLGKNIKSIEKDYKERALLIFIKFKDFKFNTINQSAFSDLSENIKELSNLAVSAGAEVIDKIVHTQDRPNPKYYISSGKLEELSYIVAEKNIDILIFDDEINPSQQNNLQDKLNIKVIDRTELILDIFAQRARSKEGKLQVELAQLNYILPRLRGKGLALSRLGGGIGTRGPGETKLEVDRRKIRDRISQLKKNLQVVEVQRNIQRKKRESSQFFNVSLIGYTNSGKSTLLNSLTESHVLAQDMLFSTLDSTTRKLRLSQNNEILISDTVGFIEKLPHQLIAAFKSTLEEVVKSDLLLLVVDISNPNYEKHLISVKNVLEEIGAPDKKILLVFNKIDKVEEDKIHLTRLKFRSSIFVSAKKGDGLDNLIKKLDEILEESNIKFTITVPHEESKLISYVFDRFNIIEKRYENEGVTLLGIGNIKEIMKIQKNISLKKTKARLKLLNKTA
jgi:GTPase